MAVKTITVTEGAYDAMKRLKSDNESFSDLFLRIGQKQGTIKDIVGLLNESPEEAAAFVERVRLGRKEANRSAQKRIDYVRSRFKRNN